MKKFIIYKSTGGMAHAISGLTYPMFIAKQHGRMLIVDTATGRGFLNDKFSNYFKILSKKINYSDNFSLLPEDIKYKGLNREKLEKEAAYCHEDEQGNAFYSLGNIKNIVSYPLEEKKYTRIEVYASNTSINPKQINLLLSTIKLNEKVYRKVKESAKPITGKYIGVHYRNTDAKNDINEYVEKVRKLCKKKGISKVYLATDDFKAKPIFEEKLPELNIISYSHPFNLEEFKKKVNFKVRNIHYHDPDKERQTLECLIDYYMLMKSNFFILSPNSGFSLMINYMRIFNYSFFDIYERNKILSKVIPTILIYLYYDPYYFTKYILSKILPKKIKKIIREILETVFKIKIA